MCIILRNYKYLDIILRNLWKIQSCNIYKYKTSLDQTTLNCPKN